MRKSWNTGGERVRTFLPVAGRSLNGYRGHNGGPSYNFNRNPVRKGGNNWMTWQVLRKLSIGFLGEESCTKG